MFCVALKNKNSGNQTLRDADLVLSDLSKLKLDDLVSDFKFKQEICLL